MFLEMRDKKKALRSRGVVLLGLNCLDSCHGASARADHSELETSV